MKVNYDPSVDAAYISLLEDTHCDSVDFTYGCDASIVGGQIHLDFDAEGRLIGIEVLDASRKLPAFLLRQGK